MKNRQGNKLIFTNVPIFPEKSGLKQENSSQSADHHADERILIFHS
jgi:hypothetical protein